MVKHNSKHQHNGSLAAVQPFTSVINSADTTTIMGCMSPWELEWANGLFCMIGGYCKNIENRILLFNKLQLVQNAATNVLTRTRKYDHISPVLSTLHLLPIKHCIHFKILLITYKALNGLAPQYLSELLSHYSLSCSLPSQNGHLIILRISKSTAGGRSFSLVPKLWNNLPNTVRETVSLNLD